MCLPHVPHDVELTLRVTLVYHDAAVEGSHDEQTVLFEEEQTDDCFVLVVVVRPRLHFLQELPSLAAVLTDKATRVSHKELPSLVAKLTCSDVGLVAAFSETSEHLLQTASDVVVDSHVVGTEQEYPIGEGANSAVKNDLELVDLFRLLFERWRPELSDFLFTHQALG